MEDNKTNDGAIVMDAKKALLENLQGSCVASTIWSAVDLILWTSGTVLFKWALDKNASDSPNM